jgi:hypothetical protein
MQLRMVDESLNCSSFVHGMTYQEPVITNEDQALECLSLLMRVIPCEGRSSRCTGIGNFCAGCREHKKLERRKMKRAEVAQTRMLKKKTPLSKVSKGRLATALQQQRKNTRKLEKQNARFKKMIQLKVCKCLGNLTSHWLTLWQKKISRIL